jgi:phytanoyl-CoA hydroxylase
MRKITNDEIAFFDENGYVVCSNVLADDELEHCQEESERLIREVVANGFPAQSCLNGPEGTPYYLTYLHAQANSFSLRLLAHPFIGDALSRMVGADFVPCYESLVFKLPENGSSVPWHRDDQTADGPERIFNIDVYFDQSDAENGGVWVVPGSHLWDIDRAEDAITQGKSEFLFPDAIPAEVGAGDLLLHHVKLLHGSQANTSDRVRRVVYFDNRAASWNNDTYHWFDADVMQRRCEMYQYALYQRRILPYKSDDEAFNYPVPDGLPKWEEGTPVDLVSERTPW